MHSYFIFELVYQTANVQKYVRYHFKKNDNNLLDTLLYASLFQGLDLFLVKLDTALSLIL
jgi:hypothetical protein